jgi:hypothetical protein
MLSLSLIARDVSAVEGTERMGTYHAFREKLTVDSNDDEPPPSRRGIRRGSICREAVSQRSRSKHRNRPFRGTLRTSLIADRVLVCPLSTRSTRQVALGVLAGQRRVAYVTLAPFAS